MKNRIAHAAVIVLCVLSVLLAGVLSIYRYQDKNFTKEIQGYIEEIVESFEQQFGQK